MDIGDVVAKHHACNRAGPNDKHPVLPEFQFLHQFSGGGLFYCLQWCFCGRRGQRSHQAATGSAEKASPCEAAERVPPTNCINKRLRQGRHNQSTNTATGRHKAHSKSHVLVEVVWRDCHCGAYRHAGSNSVDDGEGTKHLTQFRHEGGAKDGDGAQDSPGYHHNTVSEAVNQGAGQRSKGHRQSIGHGPNPCYKKIRMYSSFILVRGIRKVN